MASIWRSRKAVAMAAVGGAGVLSLLVAVAAVVLIVSDPVGTADAVAARDAGPMMTAIVSLMWRALHVVLEYL